jgi:hypothetical protein
MIIFEKILKIQKKKCQKFEVPNLDIPNEFFKLIISISPTLNPIVPTSNLF